MDLERSSPPLENSENTVVAVSEAASSPVAIVAHNADTLVLIKRAQDFGASDIELDLRFSREPRPWHPHRLHVRHGQFPYPFREYPTPEELIESISPEKTVVLDLKFLPNQPIEGRSTRTMYHQLRDLLVNLEKQGRSHLALTGGNGELFNYLSVRFPAIELRWTVWTERGYEKLREKYDERVKAVSVRAAVLKRMGIEAFEEKKVYVFGVAEEETDLFRKMGVAGIGTDRYKYAGGEK